MRRLVLLLPLILSGCNCGGATVFEFKTPPAEGDLVVLLTSDGAEVTGAVAYVEGKTEASLETPAGQLVHAAVLSAADLVGPDGQPLSNDEKALAEASINAPSGSCGRCIRNSLDKPWAVVAGEGCTVPPYARIDSDSNEVEVRALLQDVFIAWSGDCACQPKTDAPDRQPLVWQYEDHAPVTHFAGTEDNTLLVGRRVADQVASGTTTSRDFTPQLERTWGVSGAIQLSNGSFWVAARPLDESPDRDDINIYGPSLAFDRSIDFEQDKVESFFRLGPDRIMALGSRDGPGTGLYDYNEASAMRTGAWAGQTQDPALDGFGSFFDADWLDDEHVVLLAQKGWAVTGSISAPRELHHTFLEQAADRSVVGRYIAAMPPVPGSAIQLAVGCLTLTGNSQVVVIEIDRQLGVTERTPLPVEGQCIGMSYPDGRAAGRIRVSLSGGQEVIVEADGTVMTPQAESFGLPEGSDVVRVETERRSVAGDTDTVFVQLANGAIYAKYGAQGAFTKIRDADESLRYGPVVELIQRPDDVVVVYQSHVKIFGPGEPQSISGATKIVAGTWDSVSGEVIVATEDADGLGFIGRLDPNTGLVRQFGMTNPQSVFRIAAVGPSRYIAINAERDALLLITDNGVTEIAVDYDDPSTTADKPEDGCNGRGGFTTVAAVPGTAWVGGCQDILLRIEGWASSPTARRMSLAREGSNGLGTIQEDQTVVGLDVQCADQVLALATDPEYAGAVVQIDQEQYADIECVEPRFGLCSAHAEALAKESVSRPQDIACSAKRCVVLHENRIRTLRLDRGADAVGVDGFMRHLAVLPDGRFVASDAAGRLLVSTTD